MTPQSTDSAPAKRTALFAGSFNPFTRGHADIVERALALFDHIIIGIGVNADKAPIHETAVETIAQLYKNEPRVSVVTYSCLTVDFALECGADFLLRSVRSVKDFEYERDLADVNRQLSGLETVILFSRPELSAISSSIVRELKAYGRDVSQFLPQQ